jgi:hypothetical protein
MIRVRRTPVSRADHRGSALPRPDESISDRAPPVTPWAATNHVTGAGRPRSVLITMTKAPPTATARGGDPSSNAGNTKIVGARAVLLQLVSRICLQDCWSDSGPSGGGNVRHCHHRGRPRRHRRGRVGVLRRPLHLVVDPQKSAGRAPHQPADPKQPWIPTGGQRKRALQRALEQAWLSAPCGPHKHSSMESRCSTD